MINEYIDMDTQSIRYVSESSSASTSGYSTTSGVKSSSPPSPSQSPSALLQTDFSNLNMPSSEPSCYVISQNSNVVCNQNIHPAITTVNANYMNYVVTMPQKQSQSQIMLSNISGSTFRTSTTAPSANGTYPAELRILEQPVERFRFRYKSEMHGTHGSLNGANSKRCPKTFPEVELCNFNGKAVIRCSLFQTNFDSPHSHQLVVRKDDTDICDPHDLLVSPERGYVAQFQNMGIIHTAKIFIFDELLKKKMDRLKFELGRNELSTKEAQELHKETEKESKEMNLNQVRLCFEAFKVDNDKATYTRIAAPVYSNPVNNRKSAQTGELRICRLSIAAGSVSGGDDLILLVEKVNKKNIKVRFYELNEDEDLVWEAFGKFRESDVHHQYAIVCQTPPYKDKDIDRPVDVYVELMRPSDDERSYPPVTFRYKPRDVVVSRKRRRTYSSATSSTSGSSGSLHSFELPKPVQEQTAYMKMETEQNLTQFANTHGNTDDLMNPPTISEEFDKNLQIKKLIGSDIFKECINMNSEELQEICPTFSAENSISDMFNELSSNGGTLVEDGTTLLKKKTPMVKSFEKIDVSLSEPQPLGKSRYGKEVGPSITFHMLSQMDRTQMDVTQMDLTEGPEKAFDYFLPAPIRTPIPGPRWETQGFGRLEPQMAESEGPDPTRRPRPGRRWLTQGLDGVDPQSAEMRSTRNPIRRNNFASKIQPECMDFVRSQPPMVVQQNSYLQKIFRIFDNIRAAPKNLIEAQRARAAKAVDDLFVEHSERNEQHESLLHEAVAGDNLKAVLRICVILEYFKLRHLFNIILNVHNESALHTACLHDRVRYIRPLLGLGCDPNIQNRDGDTALHIAVKEQHQKCIESFLNREVPLNLTITNDEGFTPLHLAIRYRNYDIAKKLLEHDRRAALVPNAKERNNALHMAVLQSNFDLVKLILDTTASQNVAELMRASNAAGRTACDLARELNSNVSNQITAYFASLGYADDDYGDYDDRLIIKEEEMSSSSTEEDEDTETVSTIKMIEQEKEMGIIQIKDEVDGTDVGTVVKSSDSMGINPQTFNELLDNAHKYRLLINTLSEQDKWKSLAVLCKMQHLLCLWDNAEDMLEYMRKNIEYDVFVSALSHVDEQALKMLQDP